MSAQTETQNTPESSGSADNSAGAFPRKREYRYPFPPYPDGWFQVAYSTELEKGQVMPLKYFGRDLVLFRGDDGEARVLDAHCPHLGAHLGYGGVVEGNEIKCPFHAWKFDGCGNCTEVPYAKKIPPKAKMHAWDTIEKNGLIMVWWHGLGEPPKWEIPDVPQYGDDEWTELQTRKWIIRAHNQELAENSVDSAHFLYLHGTQGQPETTCEALDHVFHAHSISKAKAFGTIVEGTIDVHIHGFGFTTTRFQGIVDTLLINSVTPIDDERVEAFFAFTVKKGPNDQVTNVVGERYMAEIQRQVEADIPIWENKKYTSPPILCDGDGPIGPYRKWVRQFYSMPWPPAAGGNGHG